MKSLRFIAAASLFVVSTSALATIVGSKHDLTETANGIKVTDATKVNSEICVFCHTPHGSNTGFSGAPIWNKASPVTEPTYVLYGTTLSGNSSDTTVSNSSKACLSCHDGVSAINSLVNAPGSGLTGTNGTNKPGMTVGATTSADGTDFVMPSDRVTSIGGYGTTTGQVNLTNDHPISIQYKGIAGVGSPASLADINGAIANSGVTGVNWTTGKSTTNIKDLLKGATNDRVECSSCHDPHLGTATTFLRTGDNAGSKLCLGCHEK